jgi:hypothetical protein
MNNFNKIKDTMKFFDDSTVNLITKELIKINLKTKTNILKVISKYPIDKKFVDQLLEIKKIDYKTKQNELKTFLLTNPHIKFNFVEDWKDPNKIKLTKFLIVLDYMDIFCLMNWIGGQSKKTYSNGQVINDSSIALKKFFNEEYRKNDTKFYSVLMEFTEKLVAKGKNKELINNVNHELIQIIQAEVICRTKFVNGEYETNSSIIGYKNKITDIVNTRWLEEELYMLFYKVRFQNLLSEPKNIPLKYLVENSWKETDIKYPWLTKLISYINNGNSDAKNYLINWGVNNFDSYEENKKDLIPIIVNIAKLNTKSINEITNFIFNIGNYFKHTTYYKWYNKELNKINLFDKYKSNSLEENINAQINILNLDLEDLVEYKKIIESYHQLVISLEGN